jgi:hypothetical protein
MKNFKKIAVWILISLILQSSVLFYLDKYYFVTETNFQAKKVDTPKKHEITNVQIKVPDTATQISVSFDGKYLAYYEANTLSVVDTLTGEKKDVGFDKDIKLSYYKWQSDVDNLLIAEKKTTTKGDSIKLSRYEPQKDKKFDVNNDNKGITLPDKKSEVQDLEFSALTNMIYAKIGHSGSRNSIYAIDVMAHMNKLKINSYFTGNIVTFRTDSRMVYEDLTYHKIYVTGLAGSINIKGVTSPALLATDEDDNLYIGQRDGDKITKIFYGQVKDSTSNWKSIDIKNPEKSKDIYISASGKVYVNDNLKGVIFNVTDNKEINYKGQFLQIYNSGVYSISEGILSKTTF